MSKKKTKTDQGQKGSDAEFPTISHDPIVQQRYLEMRQSGESHNMAELLANRQAPRASMKYSPMHPRANRGRG